jgi:NADH-ubiquinone oxidoreductase chain 2
MLIVKILSITIYNALLTRRDINLLITRISLSTLFVILLFIIKTIYFPIFDKGIGVFNGLFQFNLTTVSLNAFIIILIIIIISLNGFYPRKIFSNISNNIKLNVSSDLYKKIKIIENENIIGKNSSQFKIKEYVLIIFFIITGGMFLMSANDLISIFLSIELQSYGLYLLSTIYRESELSTKAGLTYFLLGGLSSCIILLGQSLLYINSGNSSMENIYILSDITLPVLEILGNNNIYFIIKNIPLAYDYYYINLSLIVLSAGFMFKISASPFHF